MPFIEETPGMDAGVRAPQLRTPPPTLDPSQRSIWGAAARRENTIISAYDYMTERSGFTYDPDHNPLDLIRGTNYEANHLDRFVESRSAADTHARMQRIDREDEDRRILDSSGFAGFVAQAAMGMLDPTVLIPAGTIYRGYRAGRAALNSGLSVGAATGAMQAVQEGILYGTQETRTVGESTMNVASGVIVGGILGGAIGRTLCIELRT